MVVVVDAYVNEPFHVGGTEPFVRSWAPDDGSTCGGVPGLLIAATMRFSASYRNGLSRRSASIWGTVNMRDAVET